VDAILDRIVHDSTIELHILFYIICFYMDNGYLVKYTFYLFVRYLLTFFNAFNLIIEYE